MSRFYGEIQGNRGPATRQGSEASGVHGHIRGWNVGGRVEVYDRDGRDVVEVAATGGSNAAFSSVTIAEIMRGEDGPEITLMDRPEVRDAAQRLLGDEAQTRLNEIAPAACEVLNAYRNGSPEVLQDAIEALSEALEGKTS